MTSAGPAPRAARVSGRGRPAFAAFFLGVCAVLGAGTVLAAGPASAAASRTAPDGCPPPGVRVVVDFGELAADPAEAVRAGCDPSAVGERAYTSIEDAGFDLEEPTREPGFLCRVSGVPTTDPCVKAAPSDAYWSLWWADGEGGDWVYSSQGAGTLRSPEGGLIGLAWHQGDGKATPPEVLGQDAPPPTPGVGQPEAGAGAPDGSLPVWVPAGVLAALLGAGVLVTRRRGRA